MYLSSSFSMTKLTCTTINTLSILSNISQKVLYFNILSPLLTVLQQTGNSSERPFCRYIEAIVLDLKQT